MVDNRFEKARQGIYADTSENRRKHRVGQHYGETSSKEDSEDKKSKKEIRQERLEKYKAQLASINEKLSKKDITPESRKMGEELRAKMEEKIGKLSAKISGKKPLKEAVKEISEKKVEKKPEEKRGKVLSSAVRKLAERYVNFLNGEDESQRFNDSFSYLLKEGMSRESIFSEFRKVLPSVLSEVGIQPEEASYYAKEFEENLSIDGNSKKKTEEKKPEPKVEKKSKDISADSLKNDFSSLMDILSPFIANVEVSKVSGEDTEVVATHPVSEWKKGVHEVGSSFYGKSDLLELATKADSGIDMIQLRRYTSNGYGAMYRNQPVGHVIVEVLTNDWKDYDMKSEKDRKALADFLNKKISKNLEVKKEGSKVEKFDVSKAQITYPNSEKTAKEAAAEFTKILGDMGFDVSRGAPWLGWNAYQLIAPGVMMHYGSSEHWDEFYFMASITDTNTKKKYWYKDGEEKDVVSDGEKLSLKEFLSKVQELRKKE